MNRAFTSRNWVYSSTVGTDKNQPAFAQVRPEDLPLRIKANDKDTFELLWAVTLSATAPVYVPAITLSTPTSRSTLFHDGREVADHEFLAPARMSDG